MITLIHGTDYVASRKKLTALVDDHKDSQVVYLGGDLDAVGFREACEARALLAKRTLVVVELDSVGGLDFFDEKLFSYLEEIPESTDVIFWVGEKIAKNRKIYKALQKVGKVFYFEKEEDKPFAFLDALAGKREKKSYLELRNLLGQGESEIKLVQLIAWELRTLIRVKGTKKNPGLHPYVYKKSKGFAQNFTLEELKALYDDVLQADLDMKTGKDPSLVLDTLVYRFTRSCHAV